MRRAVAKLFVGMAITAIGMFGADSDIGTWKFNGAKSKSNTSNPLKNRTDVVEATPDGGVKVTRTELRVNGTTCNINYMFKYDSREYPVTGANWAQSHRNDAGAFRSANRHAASSPRGSGIFSS